MPDLKSYPHAISIFNWSYRPSRGPRRVPPAIEPEKLETIRIDRLRQAVRRNRVSFPSQIPTFEKHDRSDLQVKAAQLFFVHGWNCEDVGRRYGLSPQRVSQILQTWKRRAIQTGFIQYIPADEHAVYKDPIMLQS